jgi:hypothetical protein
MNNKWAENILQRFEDRQILTNKELYDKFFSPMELPEKDVMECFEEIEFNYSIPIGVLRPEDELIKLIEAVSTRNPLRWFFWRSKSEFREADLMDEVRIRLNRYGTSADWNVINTFQDLVLAWCGRKRPQSPTLVQE